MGRADSRASDISARDLRLTALSGPKHRHRADSRSSRLSQSGRSNRQRNSSFVSNFGVNRHRKESNALSTITEHWNLPDDQFGSPFSDFDAQEQPLREQLQRGLDIINEHTSKLKEIEDAVTSAMSEVWGYWADPVQLYLHPAERVDVQDMIKTDNELFNKVLTVFAVLCDEISELKVTVEDNFYPALIMFGQPQFGDESDPKPGDEELFIGRMLPFFQDVSNFVDRCNAITINMLHQLASLYQSFQKLWKSTFKLVHLHPVFDALGSLLEVMITIDAIVLDNPSIVTAWDKYKRMMQYVRADPARYNITVDKVKQFERLLVSLDQTIMSAQVFQTCIEQDFEVFGSGDLGDEDDEDEEEGRSGRASSDHDSRIDIRTNRVFMEEFLHCISAKLSQAESAINSPTETYEKNSLVGTAGLYVLYRRLLPPNVPADPNLYKRLWETQLKTPAITICGKISWFMADFLLKYAPMNSKKLQPADILQFRRDYLQTLDDAFPGDVANAKVDLSAWLHEENNEAYITTFAGFIDGVMEEEVVENLCKDVENDLRLHIHSVHLDHMDAPNPKSEDFKVLHYYLNLRPIRLYGKMLDLRQRVTHYLENTFYNLTTVALHDWKTYGEMRNLANDKYGLSLADNHLPMGSLDQGLDILQIMRNIQIFVARYNYNLNQQFFLERRSDKGSRHLNSINIHSIASSIRTHGMGIMNTTVNFTYQFLTKKFDIFSQFLFDEYIKSYLQREKRWYRKHRDDKDVDNKYPYDRAFQFNKDIRKLGVSDSGKTFLDQFRVLITEIGNALGYVRMVFDALHWFEEVTKKYQEEEALYIQKQAERDARKKEQAARKQKETTAELIDDEEEVHTLQMTAKRIELNRREFDLLDWSLNGARIFFKD
ncbi:hypothetical protein ATCC90586_008292 [Pythium insidiosum]|nr:hypothetical protein ATCC90586_008292 [Pythium insidiosum]